MPTKAEQYAQMADQVARQLTGSWQEWAGFLTTAARLYKYPYHEQLMIYAQRPDATACAEYDLWNNRMGRYVRRGSKGIALVDDSGDRPRLRYVFDISDTGTREHSRTPWLWQLEERHIGPVSAMLERNYDVSSNDLAQQLADVAAKLEREGLRPDVVSVDPPRKGLAPDVVEAAASMEPERIVYVSCDPATLARDVARFAPLGYRPVRACAVDLFPGTANVETVVLLSHKKPDGHINVKVEFGEGEGKVPLDNIAKRAESYKPKERVTYKMIKEYIEAKYGFKVHTAYIAEVKRDLGLPMYDAPNAVEELKQPRKHPTAEKVEAIKDALKHFEVI